ncbi:MAG: hypothetical protein WBM87_08895 [Woeseiaceae bacterium]
MALFLALDNFLPALALAVAFTLGWLAHRWLTSRREQQLVTELTEQLAFMERQRDSAHRVSLELADTHNKLVGEHLEAEWTIHSLQSDLKIRDARIKKLLVTANTERPATKTDVWSLEEARFR